MTADVKLSEGQRQAIRLAMTSPILILTGGPGCGKTYATAMIVKLWEAIGRNLKLAAPTGVFLESQQNSDFNLILICYLHYKFYLSMLFGGNAFDYKQCHRNQQGSGFFPTRSPS